MAKATFVPAVGRAKNVLPKDGKTFSLDELQKFVDGYIEILFIGNKAVVVNDDGWQRNLPVNQVATKMYRNNGGASAIVGNVLVCDKNMIE